MSYFRDEYDDSVVKHYRSQFDRVSVIYIICLFVSLIVFGVLDRFNVSIPIPESLLTFESLPTLWSMGLAALISTGYFAVLWFTMVFNKNNVVAKSTQYLVSGIISILTILMTVILLRV